MSQKFILLIILFGVVLVTGCVQQISQNNNNEISFIDMNEELQLCIGSHIPSHKQEFVINSQKEYNSLLEFKSPADFCDDFKLPTIDFSQNTLLGKYTQGGGCSINFVRHIFKDDLNKKIIYSIEVVEEGLCKKLGMSMNWILTSKVPSDYSVEFQVK